MRLTRTLPLIVVASALALPLRAGQAETLDLKPFVGPSPFESIQADWLLPRGRQVLDGTPFQIDGVILLYASNSAQRTRPGRTNVTDIPVGQRFERLHLLAGSHSSASDGTLMATIRLRYVDGSDAALEVHYGDQVRNWFGPWHKADRPLNDPNAREVWRAQCSPAATTDDYIRLFHVALTNPVPEKVVKSLSLESARKPAGLMVAGISVGPADAAPMPDTQAAPKSPYPDLRPRSGELVRAEGTVQSKDGKPIADALVRVIGVRDFNTSYNASAAEGPPVGTEVRTGADGHFVLPPLPDNKLYRVLVAAQGFEAFPYGGLDPKSDPIQVRLAPEAAPGSAGMCAVRGRLIGPEGKPVAGASIEADGVSESQGSRSWGGSHGFPEQLLSGANGEFTLAREKPFIRLQVRIHAAGLAPANVWLDVTNETTRIELGVGSVVRGRVVKEGKPLTGVRVGVVGSERNSEVFAGHYETTTDTGGRFAFNHLPANTSWYCYGIMASLRQHGSLPPVLVQTSNDGEATDLGDRDVVPGLRLSGMVQTRHGEPLPKGMKINLSYNSAWDSEEAAVDATGGFAFEGLSKGQVEVSLRQQNWRLAGINRSLDIWNPGWLTGLLEEDKTDLLLVIEKGEARYNSGSSANGQLPQQDLPQGRPIAGAEKTGPPSIVLAGQVVDDKTGQPISGARLVPGYKPPVSLGPKPTKPILNQVAEAFGRKNVPWNERPFWRLSQVEIATNGTFSVEFVPLSSTPMLRAEAEGYQAFETDPVPTNTANMVIRLKHGEGPSGVVLLPDGKPAEGASVIYAASQEQFGLTGKSLSNYGDQQGLQVTGKDGKFTFPVRAHGQILYAAHPAGWAEEAVARGGEGFKLRLKPWAALSGTLIYSNGSPVVGLRLGVTVPSDWQRGDPHLNLQGQTTTDAQGRFAFGIVPPRRVEVQRIIPMGQNGWTYGLQTWLEAQPGVTNDLGKVIYDQPPPLPMMEQLKQRLGL
jgi:protocatechuate 3,4-dioxygenase beta subunit